MSDLQDVPLTKPCLGEEEIRAAARPLTSGWVTQGPEVAAFEREFAAAVGAQYACAVSSCTAALHLALLAIGVRPGDEVITVSHSFIATANSIRYCGAKPVFVDIQRDTFNIAPELIEQAITERTRAIMCVHQMGMPCDLGAILDIAQTHHLKVIEDAACAIGSRILHDGAWESIGKPHGDIACFSFHPRKVITTGDGGMLTTSNHEYDHLFRLWRQHGMSVADSVRHKLRAVVFEEYPVMGYNYRMTDIQAAVGREQLKRLPQFVTRRRLLADRYRTLLADISGLELPDEPVWANSNWQSYCVRLPDGARQRDVMQALLDKGIATRRGIMCAHREPCYMPDQCSVSGRSDQCKGGECPNLPVSEQAQDNTIILPLFYDMTERDQQRVVEALHEACLPVTTGTKQS